jgi:uncharacterized delta-60 repeat protein
VALQANGKIVAVGSNGHGGFALARYNTTGSLDTSFSGDGKQETDFGGGDEATDVALQADGKVVAVGDAGFGSGSAFALARYNANGSLDTSFSEDGKQITSFDPGCCDGDSASGVAIQANGKIVAVGSDGQGGFALARYNPNGSLDPSFSGEGMQETDFGVGFDFAADVTLQGDGKIVAVGRGGPSVDFALARYNSNGSLDLTFSGDGKRTTDFGGFDFANGVALQGDGKIVAVGEGSGTDGTEDFALARYLGG